MKKLTFAFFFFFSISVFAQPDLRKTLSEYLKVVETKNSERVMDYMYPKFFELYPRDLMVKTLDESMNDPNLEILLMDSKILEISPLKTADTVTYAKVGYSFVMTLKYVETDENPAPGEEVITMTTNIFKQMYGDENVSFDSGNKKFKVYAKKEMLALKTAGLTDWKVLGIEEKINPLLKKILPNEIITDL
ncbi:hypothetical protein [Lacihabitans sp. CS3-21]|uniref:hypothetical protein n=1 Tax=Lacihabitans sp. CS3-21 TaxID=2487332 RepID=UPI0020CF08EA|nr:hypothetical protein [Lacihabitans sp. CS3-21]